MRGLVKCLTIHPGDLPIKITHGSILLASVNTAFAIFSPSPTHFDVIELTDMLRKLAPDCTATAFASSVLPVPGGPNSRMPEK